ncbi:MAG: bifunctional riboflavin kinase/FAD synthetase [Prevotellaceae bacterium]|jgi:riboflavin kinase/FMN adenylyltransferase|nr:bifunctional riboflavin kinase/FAD synthetase [Prevotellaceae bacterium]
MKKWLPLQPMQTHIFPNLPPLGALAATTGFFDGVHRGHQAVIREMLRVAEEKKLHSCVVTYEPHPRVVLGKDEHLRLLTSFGEKQKHLAALGVEHLVVIPFTKELSTFSAEDFFKKKLLNYLNIKELTIGHNHNIGRNADAGFEKIKALGKAHNVDVMQVSACSVDDVEVSSTKIRAALQQGNILLANHLLGYQYQLEGKVITGNKIGRKIEFPTANIQPGCAQKMLPKNGAYAVLVTVDNVRYSGMLNIGTRPTVNSENAQSIEAHIFDFSEDIYGSEITVTFVERLRNERKMSSLDELKMQLKEDEMQAKKILPRHCEQSKAIS